MSDVVELYPNNAKRIELVIRQPAEGEGTEPATGLSPTVRVVLDPTATADLHPSLTTTALEYGTSGEYYADLAGAALAARLADNTLAYGKCYIQVLVGTSLVGVADAVLRRYRRLTVTLPS